MNRKKVKWKIKEFFHVYPTRLRSRDWGDCNWRSAKRAKFYAVSPSQREPCVWLLSRSYESMEEMRARTSAPKVFPLFKCNEQ